jgi:ribonuclease BN (tRNA processing enzyme)
MQSPRLHVVGCGDAFCSGGRYHTCFLLQLEQQTMLIDCGATAVHALRQQGQVLDEIDQIVISHTHGDHFGGVPFFLLDAQFSSRRKRPLALFGPPGFERRILAAIDALFPGLGGFSWRFPLRFVELSADREVIAGEAVIRAFEVDHDAGSPALALRLTVGAKVLAFSGDTSWTEILIDVAEGADLFLCECHSYAPARDHIDWLTLTGHRRALNAKRIILTHLSPSMLDRQNDLSAPGFEFAVDGLTACF